MIALLVFMFLFWFTNTILCHSIVYYPFYIIVNLAKYLTIALLGLIVIFFAWSFGED